MRIENDEEKKRAKKRQKYTKQYDIKRFDLMNPSNKKEERMKMSCLYIADVSPAFKNLNQ
jgi:hypothetical protein